MAKFKRGDLVVHESGWVGKVINTMLDGHLIQVASEGEIVTKPGSKRYSYWDADVFKPIEKVSDTRS